MNNQMQLFNFIKNLRISHKLQIIYSLVLVISFSAGGMVIHSFVRDTIEKKIENELDNSTSSMLNMVRTAATVSVRNCLRATAEKNLDIVREIYGSYTSGEINEEEAKVMATRIMLSQRVGKTGYIYCLNSSGIVVVHPKKGMKGKDISNFRFAGEQMKKRTGYLEYEWKNPGEEKKRPKALYMKHFAPWDWIISVSSYQEEFSEMVSLHDFRESILSFKFGRTGYSYLLDYHGNALIHPYYEGRNFYHRKDADGRRFVVEICTRKTGKIIYQWKNPGEPVARYKLSVFRDIPEFGWIVASSGYLEEFYESLDTLRNLIIAAIAATILLVFLSSLYISSFITKPLNTLAGHFAKGASGDLSVRMNTGTEDEIGKLSQYFNIFMGKLEFSAKALSESEKKYRSLFENAVEGIFQSTKDGRFLGVNPSLAKLCGYDSPGEMMAIVTNIAGQLYVYPENRREFINLIEKQGHVDGFETCFYRKDRSTIWISIYARCVMNDACEVLFYEGSFVDITKRREAEEEIKQHRDHLEEMVQQRTLELTNAKKELEYSEKKFRTLFEDTSDAVMTLDDKGFTDCNPATLKMFGCRTRKDFIGKHPGLFSPMYQSRGQDSASLAAQHIQTAFSQGSHSFEWHHKRSDGTEFPAEVLLNSMKIGEMNILQAVVRDITGRRTAENAVKESRRRLSDIISFLPDPTFVIDREGKVTFWNRAIEKMTGISAEEMTGKGDYEYAIPFYGHRRPILIDLVGMPVEELEEKYPRLSREGNVLVGEAFTPNLGPNGAYLLATATPLSDSQGSIIGAIESIRDITDRKKMEEELEKAKETAEEAQRRTIESLNYAKTIQTSLLANIDTVKTYLPQSFFIWEPRDIVGGDIFFADCFDDGFVVAVIDCTGHGVPGALMTMIASSALRRIIRDECCHDPGKILNQLNFIVKTTLQQDTEYVRSDDGLDIGVCFIKTDSTKPDTGCCLTFAGARLPLYYVHNRELAVIKGDKQSIGYKRSDLNFKYANHKINIDKNKISFYMATDGFADQLGQKNDRRFGTWRFRELLKKISGNPFESQREMLTEAFYRHKGGNERQDDVTVVGFMV
ncbi:MAG: PAS domain S-box protein [Desulfobacteraceae bacterium]|nr:PAS domain S-box protein [Desulfobacteraceae bacterium]